MKRPCFIMMICSLVGCSNVLDKPAPTPLKPITESLVLDSASSASLGGSDQTGLIPVVDRQKIFAAGQSGKVFAFDMKLKKLWSTDLKTNLVGGVAVSENSIFVVTDHARLIALNRADGKIKFDIKLPSLSTVAPAASDQLVFVKTQIGRLIALNADTGELRWVEEVKETAIGIRGASPMAVDKDALYVLWEAGRLVAYQLETGRIFWERQVAVSRGRSPLERIVDSKGAPSVRSGLVATGTRNGQVSLIDGSSGQVIWSVDSDVYPGVIIGFNAITAVGTDGIISSYDIKTGEEIWSTEALRFRELSPPAVIGEFLGVVDLEGILHLLKPKTGDIFGRADTGGDKGLVAPVNLGSGALVLLKNGRLTRVDINR